ncbi:MAG: DUF721 domain-containing protein [bacterium]
MFKSIKDLLSHLVPEEIRWKITILEHWEQLIGPLNKNVILLAIKNNQLHLGVSHPTWAQELLFLTPILKEKINNLLGKRHIKDIRFKIINITAHRQAQSFKHNTSNRLKSEPCPKYTLNSKEKKMLTRVKDHELRTSIEQFFIRCKSKKGGWDESDEKRKRVL